jgi:hypothetical protein
MPAECRRRRSPRIGSGDWVQLRPEVYCAATRAPDDVGRLLAMCLAAGAPIALSGAAAAFVRRFPGIDAPVVPTAAVPIHRRIDVAGLQVERSRCFPAVVPHVRAGPVLPRADTIITMSVEVPYTTLLDCMQELTRRDPATFSHLEAALRRGRSGSAALRRVVAELSEGGDSRPERLLRRALQAGGVHDFEFGWELVLRDGTRYQPDLWNDALGFCIEVDGVANHSIASRMDSDRVRHNRLALELGFAVARFTPTASGPTRPASLPRFGPLSGSVTRLRPSNGGTRRDGVADDLWRE